MLSSLTPSTHTTSSQENTSSPVDGDPDGGGMPATPLGLISNLSHCLHFLLLLMASFMGFFNGLRGIRQGDLISPYLFVLVMEMFHVLLQLRIQAEGVFHYHWKCSELGLQVNPSKSTIILSKAVQRERQDILALVGFQEGCLPIRYLGVPLTASRLTVADCQPILDRISSRLTGWTHLNLSLVGRAQLLKSVLSSLHVYWSSVFVLPKSIIKVIEQKMRSFLWKGPSGSGFAKVSWGQVCKPKEEGGLGIRRVLHMNQALMLKHVWRILQEDPSSIWVAWVLRYRLRNQTIWTVNAASASWCWRKFGKFSNHSVLALLQPASPRVVWDQLLGDVASLAEAVAFRALEEVRYRIITENVKPSFQRQRKSRSNMKELIYVTDRVICMGSIHVYGVGITSSTHRLAAFLPLTCTSQYPSGNSRKRRPGSDTSDGREPYIPFTGEGWKGVYMSVQFICPYHGL
ncbi:UNVERIFIED_CONTAM: putative ribonuclease H protein [Sesamum latifolium]|uniref:Ribonuclease H protein n=1 Tax=Sesamum latifolium TaxID=2727402 RepID=A0AAW2WDH0_9LAMI